MFDFLARFKEKSLEERKQQALDIIKKYPERIPVILTKNEGSNVNDIDKHKFLVPNDILVSQFIRLIKKKLDVSSSTAIFLFINNVVPTSSERIGTLHKKYKDEDYFLYLTYACENTFGYNKSNFNCI